MRLKIMLVMLVCVVFLGGCNSTTTVDNNEMLIPDLSTEEGIRDYIVGNWVFEKAYLSNIACRMSIDEDLNVNLSFYNPYESDFREDYTGKIKLDRQYAKPNELPDIITIELMDTDYPGGEFFFLHRTLYDGKFVMSWFFAGNGDSVFDAAGSGEYGPVPEEIMFEKIVDQNSNLLPTKNQGFHAVFWGEGYDGESLWLDDVNWELQRYDAFTAAYPLSMILYENDVKESVLYSIDPDQIADVYGFGLFEGQVYFVETDESGNIISLIGAEHKARVLDGLGGDINSEDQETVLDILRNDTDESRDYINNGMELALTGEIVILDDWDYHVVYLGTRYEDGFSVEKSYAVNAFKRQVYYFDEYTGEWEVLGSG